MSFFPRFWKWLRFADKQGALKVTFSFFLSKKSLFSALVCEGCESKKTQIPGNAPACHVRARKTFFFLEQNMTLIMSVSSRRNSPDFYIPFSRILAPKWEDSLQLNEEDGIPIKILWFRPVSLRRNCIFELYCEVWFAKWVVSIGKTSLFRRFFTLYPHFHPYIYEGVKEESCTLRESAVEYLCEEHEWVPKIG